MQAITTRYIGPTNNRGSRVKAKCWAGSITVSWDHALGTEQNHDAAAIALVQKLGWHYADRTHNRDPGAFMYRGELPFGTGNVYVFPCDYSKVEYATEVDPRADVTVANGEGR